MAWNNRFVKKGFIFFKIHSCFKVKKEPLILEGFTSF